MWVYKKRKRQSIEAMKVIKIWSDEKKAFQTKAREKNKDDEKARRKEQWG